MTDEQSAAEVNRAHYGELSAGRDDYWRKMAAPRFRVATILSLLAEEPFDSVVDLGCGNGCLLAEIAGRWPSVRLAGIDLSGPQIEENHRSAPNILWHVANLDEPAVFSRHLPGHFDAVVASEVIEHVDQPEVFLENALALAAPPRGRLLLSTQSGPIGGTERRVGHRRHFGAEEMRFRLIKAGWQPVRIWNSGFPFHDLSKWYANLAPDSTMKSFGEGAYGPFENAVCCLLRGAFHLNSLTRGAQLFAVARRLI